MDKLIEKLKNSSLNYKINEPMSLHTTFKTGGAASLFLEPNGAEELASVLALCRESGARPFIIGNGSNLLVSDSGINDKAVIHISGGFSDIELLDETTIRAGAGAGLSAVCKFALSKGLTGLEFAYGIPGSCGGAAFMNAGAYGGEMKDVVAYCEHISLDGEPGRYNTDELDFSYRHSAYSRGDKVITAVVLRLKKGDPETIAEKMTELLGRRKEKQPLEYPSAGSVFKRPEGYFAGALIEQSGLKGKRIGGAMVSTKHAGFIINYDGATTRDILDLIQYCQETVYEKFSVKLETEIRFV